MSSVVRGFRGARVIATYPHQPRVNDVVCHQFLPEEDEPELVVGGRLSARHCVVRPLHTHKGHWKGQPVIVGIDGTKQLRVLGSEGVVKVMFLYEMLKWRPPLKKPAERKTLSSSVHERKRERARECVRECTLYV